MEQTFRAGQSRLALWNERKKASLIPEIHMSKDLFFTGWDFKWFSGVLLWPRQSL